MAETFAERTRRINQEAIDKYVDRISELGSGDVDFKTALHIHDTILVEQSKLIVQLFACANTLADKVQELEGRLNG